VISGEGPANMLLSGAAAKHGIVSSSKKGAPGGSGCNLRHPVRVRTMRCQAFSDEAFEQWNRPKSAVEPKQEELIHIFTKDLDVVTMGSGRTSQYLGGEQLESGQSQQENDPFGTLDGRMPSVEEQGLCIGATFGIQAINSVDPSRQIKVLGFCRCVHTLGWHVNRAVLTKGGVVTLKNHHVCMENLQEKLTLHVQVPFLFGVPQTWDAISDAISAGGGLIDREQMKWVLY